MNMPDPQLIIYGTTAASVLGLGLRNIFAKVAIGNALKQAAPSVEKFRSEHAAPLGEASNQNAQNLKVLLDKASHTKNVYLSEFEKLKINAIKKPSSQRLLNDEFGAMGGTIVWGAVLMEGYTFSSAYAGHLKQVMAAGGQTVPIDGAVNIIDASIIKTLDNSGVSEYVMEAVKNLGEHIPGAVTDASIWALHELMVPGVMTGISTIINEGRLAFDGGNNWDDALKYGAVPAFATYGIVKAGIFAGAKVDLASGGFTHGLGTLAGAIGGLWGATVAKGKYIGREIEKDKDQLRPYANKISEQKAAGIEAVNTVILDKAAKISELHEEYPDIENDKKLASIFERMVKATVSDIAGTKTTIESGYARSIKDVPTRSFLDRIMFVDKGLKVRDEYMKAANAQLKDLGETQIKLMEALEDNNREATIDILVNSPFLKHGKLEEFLKTLSQDLQGTADSYDESLKSWGTTCRTHWDDSQKAVETETKRQNSFMEKLRNELSDTINPIRMRIKANCTRIGRPPDPLIYV